MFKDEKLKMLLMYLGASIILVTLVASKLVPMDVMTSVVLIIIGVTLVLLGIE